jgi:hypothetical protein
MNAFLSSIGYNSWVLPALLLIPLLGAAVIWIRGAMVDLPAGADEFAAGGDDWPLNQVPGWMSVLVGAVASIMAQLTVANKRWSSKDMPSLPVM